MIYVALTFLSLVLAKVSFRFEPPAEIYVRLIAPSEKIEWFNTIFGRLTLHDKFGFFLFDYIWMRSDLRLTA
jgi:hypothetical protein